jgi:hypothetical protein
MSKSTLMANPAVVHLQRDKGEQPRVPPGFVRGVSETLLRTVSDLTAPLVAHVVQIACRTALKTRLRSPEHP